MFSLNFDFLIFKSENDSSKITKKSNSNTKIYTFDAKSFNHPISDNHPNSDTYYEWAQSNIRNFRNKLVKEFRKNN